MDKRSAALALSRLEAIAAVRPDAAPIVDVAIDVVAGALADVEQAEARATRAEGAIGALTDETRKIALRAAKAEDALAMRDQLDANERERDAAARREKVAKAEDQAALRGALADLERQMKAREALIEKLVTCHRQVEPSLIECREAVGHFIVKHIDGSTFRACETRPEALDAVDALLELERKAPIGSDEPDAEDSVDSPRRRRQAQPGECAPPEDMVPGHSGRMDGRKIQRKRVAKCARLL